MGPPGLWMIESLHWRVCIDREGLACVVEVLILNEVDVVYTDVFRRWYSQLSSCDVAIKIIIYLCVSHFDNISDKQNYGH